MNPRQPPIEPAPEDGRGVLYPAKLPHFTRYAAGEEYAHLVQWFWVPRWQLPDGESLRQEILPFPAANLTIAHDGVLLTGPSTRLIHRVLSGAGWALGLLLQPAGLSVLGARPRDLVDAVVDWPDVVPNEVSAAMAAGDDGAAIELVSAWLGDLPAPPQRALEANRLLRITAESPAVTTLGELAEALHASPRTVQRLAEDFLGLSPLQVIRRYRLQEAARHLREGTETIAGIAARLGYTDHAHLTGDFRRTFGYSPREYRAGSE